MQFLGSLGIDWKLIIAQVIDFGLLVWFLAYFVYKPTIRLIEKNEAELIEGSKRAQALDAEKRSFLAEKGKDVAEAQALSRKIVEEAKIAAEEMKSRTHEETQKESYLLLAQTEEALQAQKPMLVKSVTQDARIKFAKSFRPSFDLLVDLPHRNEMEETLYKSFLERLEAEPLEKISDNDLKELRKLKREGGTKFELKLLRLVGPVSLEYAETLSSKQKNEIARIVAEKIGLKVEIKIKQNHALVGGFRLEIMGRIIESNFLRIVEHAAAI